MGYKEAASGVKYPVHLLIQIAFRTRVQCGGWFVEDNVLALPEAGSGNRQLLPLTAGEVYTIRIEFSQLLVQFREVRVSLRQMNCPAQFSVVF